LKWGCFSSTFLLAQKWQMVQGKGGRARTAKSFKRQHHQGIFCSKKRILNVAMMTLIVFTESFFKIGPNQGLHKLLKNNCLPG
jgi:hypothetical protein